MFFELTPRAQTAIDILIAPAVYLLILSAATIYHAARYLFFFVGPPSPVAFPPRSQWTLGHYLRVNRRRVLYGAYGWLRLPRRDGEEGEVPRESAQYLTECELLQVVCPPMIGGLPVPCGVVPKKDVPGWWIRKRDLSSEPLDAPATPGERIVFFIVGGGYVGGHPLRIHTAWSIAKITNARVFCVNYRKSLSAETAFPASLLDCMAGMRYLADKGFRTKIRGVDEARQDIMLCGDSAGANACLAVARCLGEMGGENVGALCLHSPWSDMTSSFASINANRYTDHLIDLTAVAVPSHTRHFPLRSRSRSDHPYYPYYPYFSPALTPAGGFAPLALARTQVYISAGTAEAFRDEIVALYEGMRRDGVDVRLRLVSPRVRECASAPSALPIEGATHSDFVWLDRNESSTLGWSWEVIKDDFEAFWHSTQNTTVT